MASAEGKVFVVTGALGSIGAAMTKGLARTGAKVVMVVRDGERAGRVHEDIAREVAGAQIDTVLCDLGSTASIRDAARQLGQRYPKIDALVNNAAAFSATRKTTKDGFELQMGVNHLAAFLLTNLLEGPLTAARGRVVNLSMPSKEPLQMDDLMLAKKYSGMTAYGMSKAANLYFTRELARRWKGKVTSNAVYPGFVKTTLIAEAPLPIRIVFALAAASPEKGADTAVFLASAPEVAGETGQYWVKRRSQPFPRGSEDAALCRRFWDESARLVGLEPVRAVTAG